MRILLARLRVGRLRLAAALALIVALVVAIPVIANLSGSDFDAGDGNLVLNDEAKDWVNAPNLKVGIDQPTGQHDDSFGQGTKEDTAVPTVVDGSIPNNKSDLTRFYVANERLSARSSCTWPGNASRSPTAPRTWTSSSTSPRP